MVKVYISVQPTFTHAHTHTNTYMHINVCICHIYNTLTNITLEETLGTFRWKDNMNFEIY